MLIEILAPYTPAPRHLHIVQSRSYSAYKRNTGVLCNQIHVMNFFQVFPHPFSYLIGNV